MLPAAYAFDMFGKVDWGGFLFGIGALGAFVVALMAVGAVMDSGVGTAAILGGVAAIALMGVAMIPAAYAMDLMSTAFRNYVDAINTMEWSSIGKIATLAAVFTATGALAPVIMLGAAAMMVMSGAVAILAVIGFAGCSGEDPFDTGPTRSAAPEGLGISVDTVESAGAPVAAAIVPAYTSSQQLHNLPEISA